ncbi:helix-turn-helix transcriptional regulator [Acinetobacter pittii]|uniref:LexA family transcriptional regulator n=1 Tax=Acinetobacter calcoaceticus/baumannii complex TaxID=909768 RepID=UPI000461223F|nr:MULTISPECIES: helix-turn-helix transcriptional regulator [Acinetobacter calcoaceticus/baumannii complex]KCX14526.1 helix-turn-helix family protein [Acinetobacter sp. 1264765]KRI18437.1 hypothetical protein APC96_19935 [Acinetobacter pittii]MDP7901570.1 helix-turn-helix transcriptional regulator [Acinetobacter pittii]
MLHNCSERLKIERKKANLSQQKLASLLEVSDMTVKRWESGTPIPSDKLVLCGEYGLDIVFILTGNRISDGSRAVEPSNVAEGEFKYIPVHDVEVSAGDGALAYHAKDSSNRLAFRTDWLNSRGLHARDLHVVIARGDSMEPTISDKDSLLVNTAENMPKDGHVYVIRSGDMLWVKRIQRHIDGSLILISDNKSYPPMQIDLESTNDVKIIGKVVNLSKNFY